ncbi:MAG: hypothetical protein JJE23_03525 [Thermoleophilia bacterium]|nr:hypothetical protein [Thermoleophilia bacterium]
MADVIIDPRYRGPAQSANGGYACAIAAQFIEGPAEVTLRAPPPLDRPLAVSPAGDGAFHLLDGETLLAEARPTLVDLEVPPGVSAAQARSAAERYEWLEDHPYPSCFVCGPERDADDGLRIFPGPVEGRELYAAPWVPDDSLGDGSGNVRPEFVWAALDCPSGIVTDLFGEVGVILLGRLAVDLVQPLRVGDTHVVTAWPVQREGRKLDTASALFSEDGGLRAVARARWIEVAAA